MTKSDYMTSLKKHLTQLTKAEQDDVIEFYTEYIEDAEFKTESEIVTNLGTSKQLAHKILADYSIQAIENDKDQVQPASSKSKLKLIWMILLGILSTPVTIPGTILAIILFSIVLIIVAAFTLFMLALILSGFLIGASTLYSGIVFLFLQPFTGLFYLGVGLTSTGIALLIIYISLRVWQKLLTSVIHSVHKIYQKFSHHQSSVKEAI